MLAPVLVSDDEAQQPEQVPPTSEGLVKRKRPVKSRMPSDEREAIVTMFLDRSGFKDDDDLQDLWDRATRNGMPICDALTLGEKVRPLLEKWLIGHFGTRRVVSHKYYHVEVTMAHWEQFINCSHDWLTNIRDIGRYVEKEGVDTAEEKLCQINFVDPQFMKGRKGKGRKSQRWHGAATIVKRLAMIYGKLPNIASERKANPLSLDDVDDDIDDARVDYKVGAARLPDIPPECCSREESTSPILLLSEPIEPQTLHELTSESPECHTRHMPNYSVSVPSDKTAQRVYVEQMPDIIGASTTAYFEVSLIGIFQQAMVTLHASASGIAQWYNESLRTPATHVPNNFVLESKLTAELVYDAFFLHGLLLDAYNRHEHLTLPNSGEHRGHMNKALEDRNR
ncbi:uncharacterized protein EV420DRAFT_1646420 [Desarmillaria tabescens]|uniref:CxC5 like cysteine cluster associated with KDZ domain-containing protein n=1 Tax=Armillaria tabescens TaxID=1929756 RepID=A0AA39MY99_ARMTA|nr:uncharacterized protein EV420DRAFT_1646420 [Desarmillaria tabescens]KAK0450499.1 hypothetical protein EV420DRAFT_1646420 [Desarmillaria tabescens]